MTTGRRHSPRELLGDPANDGYVLTTEGGVPRWAAPTGGGSETLPASIIDDKGDLIVGTAADTPARLPVGADGEILVADSGEAGGMKWEAPATAVHTAVFYAAVVAVGTGALKLRNLDGAARTILAVAADVVTAPTGGSVVVDVHKNGTTIFTTQANRPTITTGNTYSGKVTAIDVTNWPDGEYLTVDIDTATSPAARLQVTVVYQ